MIQCSFMKWSNLPYFFFFPSALPDGGNRTLFRERAARTKGIAGRPIRREFSRSRREGYPNTVGRKSLSSGCYFAWLYRERKVAGERFIVQRKKTGIFAL